MRAIEPLSYVTHLQAPAPSAPSLTTVLRLALLVVLVTSALWILGAALVSPSMAAANIVCGPNGASETILPTPIQSLISIERD
jgi:hypothetical protein